MKQYSFYSIILFLIFSCNLNNEKNLNEEKNSLIYEKEVHFKNMKQLTFGGENAEAYWSFDDSKLIFQATNEKWGQSCDQIYIIDTNNYNLDKEIPKMVRLGLGRTTCSSVSLIFSYLFISCNKRLV